MRILFVAMMLATAPAYSTPPADETGRNSELILEYNELGRKGEYEKQAAFWTADAINNGRPMRPEMIRTILEDIHRTFPDYRSEAIQTIAQGDTVVILSRLTGTHLGVARTNFNGGLLQGARATGKKFEIIQTHWWKLRDGKICFHQGVRDDLSLMKQLGLVSEILPAEKRVPTP